MHLNGFNVISLALCVTSLEGSWIKDGYQPSFLKEQSRQTDMGSAEVRRAVAKTSTPAPRSVKASGDAAHSDTNALTLFLNRFQPAMDRDTQRLTAKDGTAVGSNNFGQGPPNRNKPETLIGATRRFARANLDGTKGRDKTMTHCSRLADKIICRRNNLTYIINTKNRFYDRDQLSKAVATMYEKLRSGENSFNISLRPDTDSSSMFLESFLLSDVGSFNASDPSVTVECSPSEEKTKGVNRTVQEVVYTCTKRFPTNETEVVSQVRRKTPPFKVRDFTDQCFPTHPWCPRSTLVTCCTSALPKCTPCCPKAPPCLCPPPKCEDGTGGDEELKKDDLVMNKKDATNPKTCCPIENTTPPCCPAESLTTCTAKTCRTGPEGSTAAGTPTKSA